MRPDGTVIYFGATGHNAIYKTPTPEPGQRRLPEWWSVPGHRGRPGSPAAEWQRAGRRELYFENTRFFEFDGTHLNAVPAPPNAPNFSSYEGRMLVLPTGQVLFTDGSTGVQVYTAAGNANPAWAPVITKVPANVIRGKTYVAKGTQFNGLSEGGAYGDDAQAATNYPLVRITNNSTGHVFYAPTKNHSSMGVATGNALVTTHFTVPVGIELGASKLQVVANGIASTAVNININ